MTASTYLLTAEGWLYVAVLDLYSRRIVGWAMGVAADVTDPAQVEAYVQATLARHGRLDVFFNNAGIEGAVAPIVDYPLEVFDKVMAVNVRGVFLGLKYVIPAMAKGGGGSIVITSSLGGLRGVHQ